MKKLSESIWANSIRRSNTKETRTEDKHRFYEAFQKIKNADTINFGTEISWTPFNFGSESVNEPGLYMNGKDILELEEYLNGTGYRIANISDFRELNNTKNGLEKIGKYFSYTFEKDGKKLYIPKFGYISGYYTEHPEEKPKITRENKNDRTFYGSYNIHSIAFIKILKDYDDRIGFFLNVMDRLLDKLQVRLVKINKNNL